VPRRLSLIVPLVLMAMGFTAAFGAAVFAKFGFGEVAEGAVFSLIAAGAGWIGMIVAGAVMLRGMRGVDYVGHLAVTMFTGALVLVPATLLTLVLPREVAAAIDIVSVLAAFAVMYRMQVRRVAALQLRPSWVWAWAVVVIVTTAASILSHFRERIF